VLVLSAVGSMVLVGCAEDATSPPLRDPFIALTSDFEGFLTWPSVEITPADIAGGHPVGPSHVYLLGETPLYDEEPFALGTIVVKTVENGTFETWEVHAMVKRGGDYNLDGAVGWEWFELSLDANGAPAIGWRGEGSAADPGGYVTTDGEIIPCNDCHIYAWRRDHVFSLPALWEAGL
jgi:hypothetical protein